MTVKERQQDQKQQNLGRILLDLERITEEDVDRALQYQRENGGFFGEALVEMGVVNRQEVGWCLATQANIPYIFPQVDEIDPDTVTLVTREWALRHMALPIMQSEGVITLAIDSPLNSTAPTELQWRTGKQVELALAPSESLKKLIENFFDRYTHRPERHRASQPVSLETLHARAHASGTRRWGISSRSGYTMGWYEIKNSIRRFPLDHNWKHSLDESLNPGLSDEMVETGEREWKAEFRHSRGIDQVRTFCLETDNATELLFLVDRTIQEEAPIPFPSERVLGQLREIINRGPTVIGITSDPPNFAQDLLPKLPGVLLSRQHRTVYLNRNQQVEGAADLVYVDMPESTRELIAKMIWLEQFHFDAAIIEMPVGGERNWNMILKLAPIMIALIDGKPGKSERSSFPGIDWLMYINGKPEGKWALKKISRVDSKGDGNGKD